MILCINCKGKDKIQFKGDGNCIKHGRFSVTMAYLKEPCSECAKEKNICQICGESLGNDITHDTE